MHPEPRWARRSPVWHIASLLLILASAAPTARGFPAGSVLILDPNVGVRQWTPDSSTSTVVISGPPLYDPRGIAVDRAGNAIVADPFAGTLRYTPSGAFQASIGLPSIDVAIGSYSGSVYELTGSGDVYILNPPFVTLVAGSIPDPRGITSSLDQYGNDEILVTSGANGGELLRVWQQNGTTTVLATNLGAFIEKPGVDRFGNVLVPRNGEVYVFDPNTGAQRGMFSSSTFDDPQDVTTTSGDRYFVADGDGGGECRIVEIDPIRGGATLAAPTTMCSNSPWSIAAVPGGTASPKLATGDVVLSDTGAFGGAGGIFRMSNAGAGVRALRLGGTPVALDMLRIGPTRELIAAGPTSADVNRIDPGTGRATPAAYGWQIGGTVMGAAYDRNGDLLLAVENPNNPRGAAGWLLRDVRALESVDQNVIQLATLDGAWWSPCCTDPKTLLFQYRSLPSSRFASLAILWTFHGGSGLPAPVAVSPVPGAPIAFSDQTFDSFTTDHGVIAPDGTLYFNDDGDRAVIRIDTTGTRSVLSSNGFFTTITGLALDESGNVLVADLGINGVPGVIRVSPSNGQQSVLTKMAFVAPAGIAVVPPPACSDGIDNDGDGLVDYPADPGCWSPDDPWETVDCSDGIDNDGDGLIDWDPNGVGPDPSCSGAQFGVEQTECSDGADNDGDGLIDLADPQCMAPSAGREAPLGCGLLGIEVVVVAGWAVGRKARRARAEQGE